MRSYMIFGMIIVTLDLRCKSVSTDEAGVSLSQASGRCTRSKPW